MFVIPFIWPKHDDMCTEMCVHSVLILFFFFADFYINAFHETYSIYHSPFGVPFNFPSHWMWLWLFMVWFPTVIANEYVRLLRFSSGCDVIFAQLYKQRQSSQIDFTEWKCFKQIQVWRQPTKTHIHTLAHTNTK